LRLKGAKELNAKDGLIIIMMVKNDIMAVCERILEEKHP